MLDFWTQTLPNEIQIRLLATMSHQKKKQKFKN